MKNNCQCDTSSSYCTKCGEVVEFSDLKIKRAIKTALLQRLMLIIKQFIYMEFAKMQTKIRFKVNCCACAFVLARFLTVTSVY